MAIITTVSFISATLVLFLPETSGYDMPQTLQQGEDFGKDQKFWSIPCCKGSDSDIKRRDNKDNENISY